MKNTIKIGTSGEDLLAMVDDGTNKLYINGTEVPAASWTGAGTYSMTVQGHTVTVAKVADATGNVCIRKTGSYAYELYKAKSGSMTVSGDLTVTGSISEGGTLLTNKYLGKLTELWTNDPLGNISGGTVVALSESAANFSLLAIVVRYRTDVTREEIHIVPTSGDTMISALAEDLRFINGRVVTVSGTSVTFATAYEYSNGGGAISLAANYCTPVAIYGIR